MLGEARKMPHWRLSTRNLVVPFAPWDAPEPSKKLPKAGFWWFRLDSNQ